MARRRTGDASRVRRQSKRGARTSQTRKASESTARHARAMQAEFAKPVPTVSRTPRMWGAQTPPRPLPMVEEKANPDLPVGYSTAAGYFTGGE